VKYRSSKWPCARICFTSISDIISCLLDIRTC
jgi:hypothetical protein